jgi:hypothetical protein
MDEIKNYIIIGVSKSGKTTFLNHTLGTDFPAGFNSGKSVTKEVIPIKASRHKIFDNALILDTPGLPDSDRDDRVVANEIIKGLLLTQKQGISKIHGILFILKIGELFSLPQYSQLFKSMSNSFCLDNICVLFTRSNSIDEDELPIMWADSIKMCKKERIANFVFWDSKKPILNDNFGRHQESTLSICLKQLRELDLDKLKEFDNIVKNKAKDISLQRQTVKTRTAYKNVDYPVKVNKDIFFDETYLHNEYVVYNCRGKEKRETFIISVPDSNYDNYVSHECGVGHYSSSAFNVCNASVGVDDKTKGKFILSTYASTCKTHSFFKHSEEHTINYWVRIKYKRKIVVDGLEIKTRKESYNEPYVHTEDPSIFVDEARNIVIDQFITKLNN